LKFGSDGLDFVHHPEQVAAPELFDLRFRVAAAGDLRGQFESFARIVPADHAKDRFNGELHNTECYFSGAESPPELLRGQARAFGHDAKWGQADSCIVILFGYRGAATHTYSTSYLTPSFSSPPLLPIELDIQQ
jgi:hypothetical protein